MICWRCHSNSVNTGSRLPICSDVKTRKRQNVVGIDMIRNNRIKQSFHAPLTSYTMDVIENHTVVLRFSFFSFVDLRCSYVYWENWWHKVNHFFLIVHDPYVEPYLNNHMVVSNHVNSNHVPSFSCLDVWTNRQATSGVYAITVTTSVYHSRRCGIL